MAITFSDAFGIHESGLALRGRRAEVLANNIANADTPGYQARDLDFRQLLADEGSKYTQLRATHSAHLESGALAGEAGLMYRTPLQPSIDGNTVDMQIEQAEYMKNALQFQASLTFLNGKVRGLMSAIRGE